MLLAEQFDESMVLLASKLCWPLEFVISLKINARKKSEKVKLFLCYLRFKAWTRFVPPSLVCVYIIIYLQVKLNAKEKSILEKWQTGDLKLYNHYKHKFNKMVSKMLNQNTWSVV